MAFRDTFPAGTRVVKSKDGYTLYETPDGKQYTIHDASGEIPRGGAYGEPPAEFKHKDVQDVVADVLDPANALHEDENSPENQQRDAAFKQLVDAAGAFGSNYAADRAAADAARGLDLDTISRLQAAADGKVPSAAEMQARKSLDQAASQGLGLAATLGGSNPGMALRAGLEAQQTAAQKGAADAAMLRAKELEAARAMLADQTARGRQIDSTAAAQTGQTFGGIVTAPYEALTREKAADQAFKGSIIGAGASALSDISAKKDIRPAPAMADDFLRSLNPQSFEYKQPGPNAPAGQRLGVMAQDLPRQDVVTAPDGKKWISADVMSDVLAGLGRVNQKVEAVQGDRPAPKGADPRQYAAAMDYVTQGKPRDASAAARGAGGMPPNNRPYTDEELGIANQMIPASVVRDFLAGLGMVGGKR